MSLSVPDSGNLIEKQQEWNKSIIFLVFDYKFDPDEVVYDF